MPTISNALNNARRNGKAFLLGFRMGVREYFKTVWLIWRVIRYAFHMLKSRAVASEGWANAQVGGAAFVAGMKSGSYEFFTPLRFTGRLVRNGFGKVVNKLDDKYLNVTEPVTPDYSKITLREAVVLAAKRGFSSYFALPGDLYRWLRRNRIRH